MKLSEHLSLREFLRTNRSEFEAAQKEPPPAVMLNAHRLALDFFEPARALCGPMIVSSGWRCIELNRAVGGSQNPLSAHVSGRAIDFSLGSMALVDGFMRIARAAIPYDKLILESDGRGDWIHGQIAEHWQQPRRMLLQKLPGQPFERFNAADPEILRLNR